MAQWFKCENGMLVNLDRLVTVSIDPANGNIAGITNYTANSIEGLRLLITPDSEDEASLWLAAFFSKLRMKDSFGNEDVEAELKQNEKWDIDLAAKEWMFPEGVKS